MLIVVCVRWWQTCSYVLGGNHAPEPFKAVGRDATEAHAEFLCGHVHCKFAMSRLRAARCRCICGVGGEDPRCGRSCPFGMAADC